METVAAARLSVKGMILVRPLSTIYESTFGVGTPNYNVRPKKCEHCLSIQKLQQEAAAQLKDWCDR